MHNYFVLPGIDAAKMRDEASRKLRDIYSPEESNVHYHKATEHCDERCEQYRFSDLEKGDQP